MDVDGFVAHGWKVEGEITSTAATNPPVDKRYFLAVNRVQRPQLKVTRISCCYIVSDPTTRCVPALNRCGSIHFLQAGTS
jgi:hypothetical protein